MATVPTNSRFASRFLMLALFVGFAAVAYTALRDRAAAGKGMPAFSVYAGDRNGLATAASVLRGLGWQPVAVTRPIQHTRHRGLLFLVEPRGTGMLPGLQADLSDADTKGLLSWVAQGNTLFLCGRKATVLHDALGVGLKIDDDAAREETTHLAEPGEAGGYTDRIARLEVEGKDSVRARRGVPLWWVDGQPGAVLVRHGAGRVLVVPDPSLLTHRGLRREDNVMLLYNLAALDAVDRRVYFDEYHHGVRSGAGTWGYLRKHDQHWGVLQLLLVTAVAVWGVSVRLGPAVPTPPPMQADAVDYASAVARIYQRAGVHHLLARFLLRDFFDALTVYLRLRRSAFPAQILAAWGRRYPGDSGKRLEELLHGAAELRQVSSGSADISEGRLWSWAKAFDEFLRNEGVRSSKSEVLRAD